MTRDAVTTSHVGGFAVKCLPRAESIVHTRVVPDPEAFARSGTVLRESMSRVTARVCAEGLGTILLKSHRRPRFWRAVRSLLSAGRSLTEWNASRYLAGLGLPVPEALGEGEERRLRVLGRSFFLSRFEDGLRDLATALADQPPPQAKRLHTRVAKLVRSMHDFGFDHRDLHPGNVLVGPGPGESCRLRIVDLHRVCVGPPVSMRRRIRALAFLHAYMHPPTPESTLRDWLSVYEPDTSLHPEMSDRVHREMGRLRATRRKSRAKRCMMESTVYTRDVPMGRGARRRDVDADTVRRAIEAHRRAASSGEGNGIIKQSDRSTVTRVDGTIVKQALPGRGLRGVRHRLVPRLDQSGYRNAHRLMEERVGTARPLALVQSQGHTFTLYDDLDDCVRLDHLARDLFARADRRDGMRLLRASAAWVGDLHARGIYHGDLKGVNVLVRVTPSAFAFHLIDTDRCRFSDCRVDLRRRTKNLAQLAASIPVTVTKTDRLRWFRIYGTHSGAERAPTSEREIARRVQDALDQKIVVTDEPIE